MFILDANFVPHPAYDVLNILGRMRWRLCHKLNLNV
jgi:hypothetical protein